MKNGNTQTNKQALPGLSSLGLSLTRTALALLTAGFCSRATAAESLSDLNAKLDLNLRYATVDQDRARRDADALTLRTRLNYTTKSFSGFLR